jgi:hypothetical protein
MHFTSTSASWLNMVERFFSEITTKKIRRGIFKSVETLIDSIMDFVKKHNENPKIFTLDKGCGYNTGESGKVYRSVRDRTLVSIRKPQFWSSISSLYPGHTPMSSGYLPFRHHISICWPGSPHSGHSTSMDDDPAVDRIMPQPV